MRRILERLCPAVFVLAILVGLLGRQISTRNTKDYQKLQPEFTGPDMIETVMHDPVSGQIYVCYSDANFVNVYSESGEFRWAVGTPYIRGNQYCRKDGMLVCYGGGTAYLYDEQDGTFLGTADEDTMELPYDSDRTEAFDWDSFQVYDAGGNVLVDRPAWYCIFDFFLTWCIAAIAGLGIFLLDLQDRGRDARSARRKTGLTDRRARAYRTGSIAMIVLHLGYGIAMLFHESIHPWLVTGIFPITIHFILADWIWMDRNVRWDLPEEEYAVTRFWHMANIASLIIMVVLFILAVAV